MSTDVNDIFSDYLSSKVKEAQRDEKSKKSKKSSKRVDLEDLDYDEKGLDSDVDESKKHKKAKKEKKKSKHSSHKESPEGVYEKDKYSKSERNYDSRSSYSSTNTSSQGRTYPSYTSHHPSDGRHWKPSSYDRDQYSRPSYGYPGKSGDGYYRAGYGSDYRSWNDSSRYAKDQPDSAPSKRYKSTGNSSDTDEENLRIAKERGPLSGSSKSKHSHASKSVTSFPTSDDNNLSLSSEHKDKKSSKKHKDKKRKHKHRDKSPDGGVSKVVPIALYSDDEACGPQPGTPATNNYHQSIDSIEATTAGNKLLEDDMSHVAKPVNESDSNHVTSHEDDSINNTRTLEGGNASESKVTATETVDEENKDDLKDYEEELGLKDTLGDIGSVSQSLNVDMKSKEGVGGGIGSVTGQLVVNDSDGNAEGSTGGKKKKDKSDKKKRKKEKKKRRKSWSRSRSPSHNGEPDPEHAEQEFVIDKMKLLEIAKANALKAIKEGQFYNNMNTSDLAALERKLAANKSVEDFTRLCEEISVREEQEDAYLKANEDGSDEEEEEDITNGFVKHPFRIKDATMIMNIRHSIARQNQPFKPYIPPKEVTQSFPVSSGQQHRKKEVEIEKAVSAGHNPEEVIGSANVDFPSIDKLPPVSEIVSNKIAAQKVLKGNANDWAAQLTLHKAEQQLQTWAQASPVPGMFTGTTSANLLTFREIEGTGQQAWARKDMFHNLRPIREGYGMRMLVKMGWLPGKPIGKTMFGALEPVAVEVKSDRKGLASFDEKVLVKKNPIPNVTSLGIPSVRGKHPVTALIEFTKRNRLGPPEFTLLYEGGADHRKIFQMKVRIGTTEYQPSITSPNKKEAKAVAALAALQALGVSLDMIAQLCQNAQSSV